MHNHCLIQIVKLSWSVSCGMSFSSSLCFRLEMLYVAWLRCCHDVFLVNRRRVLNRIPYKLALFLLHFMKLLCVCHRSLVRMSVFLLFHFFFLSHEHTKIIPRQQWR